MDNSFNVLVNQKSLELKSMQKSALLQAQVIPGNNEVMNVPCSIMKALDFTIEIDDDELYPPEDLRSSLNPTIKQKIKSPLQGGPKSALDNIRMSNPS